MTETERIAALEARLKVFEDFFTFGLSDDGLVPYVSTAGRIGMMSNYWCKRAVGQGAAVSTGSAIDRFMAYFDVDPGLDGFATCPDHPATAAYGSSVQAHRPGEAQPNIAFEAHAANAPAGNICYYGDYQYAPNADIKTKGIWLREVNSAGDVLKEIIISANAITVKDGVQGGGFSIRHMDAAGNVVKDVPLW